MYAAAGVWYADIGATSHMTGDKGVFESLDGKVKFGDGKDQACGWLKNSF